MRLNLVKQSGLWCVDYRGTQKEALAISMFGSAVALVPFMARMTFETVSAYLQKAQVFSSDELVDGTR